jgi:hypothetical protein
MLFPICGGVGADDSDGIERFEKTNTSYGVNEVLLASVIGAVVFSLLAAQPLCIVGVTGPITVFN